MSNVSADAAEFLQHAKNIQNAVSSIEQTRASIANKYKQLGTDWNDKKYRELGDVVSECNKALMNIYKVLLQSKKYVAALEKSLQEYENVNMYESAESDNAFTQGLRDMSNYSSNTGLQYCLGVVINGTIPDGYVNVLASRYQNAENSVRRVFDNFTQQLNIRDANYPPNQTAHYSPMDYPGHPRGVYYNAQADMNNPRGAGTTYYHELAHMIDHSSTGCQGNLSNSTDFGNALIQDGQTILSVYNGMTQNRQANFSQRIHQDFAHSFSDLIDATTGGQLHGSYGHSREYWQRPGNLQAEAFAHFFEASMGGGCKLELLANFFPTAFAIFSDMIESILPDERVRVLERGR